MFNRMLVGLILLFAGAVHAQFQFFDNFFSGHQGGQQAQQQGNSPSDSNWYQQNWDQGQAPLTALEEPAANPNPSTKIWCIWTPC